MRNKQNINAIRKHEKSNKKIKKTRKRNTKQIATNKDNNKIRMVKNGTLQNETIRNTRKKSIIPQKPKRKTKQ